MLQTGQIDRQKGQTTVRYHVIRYITNGHPKMESRHPVEGSFDNEFPSI